MRCTQSMSECDWVGNQRIFRRDNLPSLNILPNIRKNSISIYKRVVVAHFYENLPQKWFKRLSSCSFVAACERRRISRVFGRKFIKIIISSYRRKLILFLSQRDFCRGTNWRHQITRYFPECVALGLNSVSLFKHRISLSKFKRKSGTLHVSIIRTISETLTRPMTSWANDTSLYEPFHHRVSARKSESVLKILKHIKDNHKVNCFRSDGRGMERQTEKLRYILISLDTNASVLFVYLFYYLSHERFHSHSIPDAWEFVAF